MHLLVIHKLPGIYTKFKQRWLAIQADGSESSDDDDQTGSPSKKPVVVPLWKRLNKDGYTPLTLAAKLGEAEMFSFLLEERKITQWSYGPVACVLYPLDQVDLEIHDKVRMNRDIALVRRDHCLVLSRTESHRWVPWRSSCRSGMSSSSCIRV